MGLLSFLTGQKKILSYEILLDKDNNIAVNIIKNVQTVPKTEYIRLWAFYQAKIIYNLGYPKSSSAFLALEFLDDIITEDIDSEIDCFRRAGLSNLETQYTNSISLPIISFNGEFYAKGSFYRNLQTHFPIKPVTPEYERKIVYSGVSLMKYCISIIKEDKESLAILTKTAKNFSKLY